MTSVDGPSWRTRVLWGVLGAGLLVVTLAALFTGRERNRVPPDRLGPAPAFTLTDQDGNPFSSGQLVGRVWMADFIFTRCQGLCPVLTRRFEDVAAKLDGRKGWALVSVTVDPEHDTPPVLTRYIEENRLETDGWSFLTGHPDSIQRVVIDGFHLAMEETPESTAEPIIHSKRVVLVDRSGVIRGYYDGLDEASMRRLVHDADFLLSEAS